MKKILQSIFNKTKKEDISVPTNEPISQVQNVQLSVKKLNEDNLPDLFFNIYLSKNNPLVIQYKIYQIKQIDNNIKCIAKITEQSKKELQNNCFEFQFLKNTIIFSLQDVNKYKPLYLQVEQNKKSKIVAKGLIDTLSMPYACLVVTMGQKIYDIESVRQCLQYCVNCAIETFESKFF